MPAVTKALAIVRFLNSASSSGASLHAIATSLGITKSHCHNILKTLAQEHWLIYDGERRTYSLAPRLLADVSRLLERQSPSLVIRDELVKLSRATGSPCLLTRVERDGSFVVIDKAEEAGEMFVSVPIGHRFPPDAPAQMRVRLAWMSQKQRTEELARWRPRAYTNTTLVDKRLVLQEIEATRRRRYSVSRAEFSRGVMTLAVPIFDPFGDVQMVLQSPGLMEKVVENEAALAADVVETGSRLNAIFGVTCDPPPAGVGA